MPGTDRQEAIKNELQRLQDANGRITPKIVWEAARDRHNPLHEEFVWDVREAAEKHWDQTARKLIQRYLTVSVIEYGRAYNAVVYVRDPSTAINQQGYVAITHEGLQLQEAEAILLRELAHCEHAIERARGIVAVLSQRFPGLSDRLQDMLTVVIDIRRRFDDAAE